MQDLQHEFEREGQRKTSEETHRQDKVPAVCPSPPPIHLAGGSTEDISGAQIRSWRPQSGARGIETDDALLYTTQG